MAGISPTRKCGVRDRHSRESGKWSQGDWNADFVTDVSDFNAWNSNKSTASDSPASSGVFTTAHVTQSTMENTEPSHARANSLSALDESTAYWVPDNQDFVFWIAKEFQGKDRRNSDVRSSNPNELYYSLTPSIIDKLSDGKLESKFTLGIDPLDSKILGEE